MKIGGVSMKHNSIWSLRRFCAAVFIIAMSLPLPAYAVSTLAISSGGDGVFLLQGMGIEDASAFEINILYDTNTLANPQVVEGPLISGAMTAINQSLPGMVRMVIIRLTPIKGSGVIATLSFDRKGSSPGIINSMNIRLANINGSPLSALAQISNPQDAASNVAASSQNQNIASGTTTTTVSAGTPATTSVPSIIPSMVVIAGQPGGAEEINKQADATRIREQDRQTSALDSAVSIANESAAPTQKTEAITTANNSGIPKAVSKAIYTQKSVLDRFKEYKGERTIAALVSLFENESMIGCRQEPPVSISDGKSIVRVIFVSTPGANLNSNIAVMGARLISLKRDADYTNTWIAELLPEKDTYQASLAVTHGGMKTIFPLTVSPKVDVNHVRSGSWTDADFVYYLKGQHTDLNKDGKRDYIDDYIFTANYLDALGKTQGLNQKPVATVAGQ